MTVHPAFGRRRLGAAVFTVALGLAAVLALDYADIVAGYDEYAACDVTTTRLLCTRSDDRVLAHDVLDGLKAQ